MQTETLENPTLIPLSEWDKHQKWPTTTAMRQKVYHESRNGMKEHGVVLRVGRRVLINLDAYFRWVKAQQGNGGGE